jgi:hypothetical protein
MDGLVHMLTGAPSATARLTARPGALVGVLTAVLLGAV